MDNLQSSQKSVSLQCVFHSIRFKVNKGWSTAVLLFLCLYSASLMMASINGSGLLFLLLYIPNIFVVFMLSWWHGSRHFPPPSITATTVQTDYIKKTGKGNASSCASTGRTASTGLGSSSRGYSNNTATTTKKQGIQTVMIINTYVPT